MVDSIKITALQNIGANIAYTTLVPLVNMAGTPTTQKANLQILGNLILNGAGGSYFARAAQANLALSVANAAQPNITSVGTLTSLTVTGNITAGNISGGNIVVANFYYGDGGFLTNVVANGSYSNSNVAAYLPTYTGNVGAGNVNVTGTVYANGLSSTGLASLTTLNVSTTANLGAVSNITITGGSAGQKLTTNGNGVLSWTNDANSSYSNSNVVTLLSAFGSNTITTTGNISAGNVSATTFTGALTGNATGSAATVTTNAQPNITSVGTLTSLTVSGNISGGNLVTGGEVVANGNVSSGTGLTTGGFLSVDGTADLHNTTVTGYANVNGTANTVGGGATVGVRSILAIDSAFGSNNANDPASAQAVRGRVTGNNLTKTRNYVAGVTGQYLVTGTNASEFINTGLLGVVGDQTTTANAAVVAYLDGDGGLTTAGSAYGVSMKNSTPGSGFDYGLDLQFINLNVAGTTTPFKQADIRFNNGVELVANTANNISIDANVTVGNITANNLGNISSINIDGSNSNVLYGNGVFAAVAGGNANTGNVTFDDNIVIGTGDEYGFSGLYLAVGPDSIANGTVQYLRVRGGDAPTHIHLDTGNNQFYDQYFGDDTKYVKLELGDAGNVVVGTVDANGNPYSWSFTSDGNLILAGGNSVIQSIANSSLDTLNPNVSTMVLTPDSGYNSQALVLDPTAPGHIHLRAPGANIDEPSANIFLGGEESSFEVGYYNGSAPNLFIHSNNNTWMFGIDGNITFPRDGSNISTDPYLKILGGPSPQILSEDASLAGPANLAIVTDYLNLSGSNGNRIAIYADNGEIGTEANMALYTNLANPGNIKSWILDTTGNLTLPDTTSVLANVSITLEANDTGNITGLNLIGDSNANLYAHGNVTIVSDSSSNTTPTWTFGNNGILTLPGGSQISETANVSTNITANGRTWAFDVNGNLTLPGNLVTPNGANAQVGVYAGTAGAPLIISAGIGGTAATSLNAGAGGDLTITAGDAGSNIGNQSWGEVGGDLVLRGGNATGPYVGGNVAIYSGGSPTTPGAISLYTGANQWTFDATGNLTIPGSLINDTSMVLSAPAVFNICTIATAGSGYNTGSSLKATTGGSGSGMTVGIGYGLSNQLTSVSVVDPGTGYVNGDVITVSEGTGGTFVITKYNVLANQTNNNTIQTDLIFANNTLTIPADGNLVGNLIVPGSIVSSGASPAPYISGFSSITLAYGAKIKDTSSDSVSFGQNAGNASQGSQAVAIGLNAGANGQANGAVALGVSAGQLNQGITGIAIGDSAGSSNQGLGAVAIGAAAGFDSQGQYSVAMGYYAGNTSQGNSAVAIGENAGYTTQGISAVAVGDGAGRDTQGQYAVAVGYGAGNSNQANNSIILNATGSILDQTTANTFTVAPVRNDTSNIAEVMFYNATSKEVTYGNTISVAGNITGAYILGNGSGLTSLPAPTVTPDISSTGDMSIMTYDGVIKSVNYATVEPSSGNIAGGNISTTGIVTANTANITTGNITTINSGLLQNGNSNITLTANGNVSIQSAGSNVELVVTSTGANVTGTFNATGNISGGNISATGNVSGTYLVSTNASANEGGEISLAQPPNGNLSGGITIDAYQNTLRMFEQGGTARGLSVDIANSPAGGGTAIGYRDIPQVAAGNVTLGATDAGKHYYSTTAGNLTLTIPLNSSVPFTTGTAISIVVQAAGNILVNAAAGVTLYMAGNSTAANRVVGGYGMATLMKVGTDTWFINGTGVA